MARTWKYQGLLCLCIVLLIVALPITTARSQSEGWTHGCDSAAIPAIAATTSQLDYAAMCQQYLDCGSGPLCLVNSFMSAEVDCEDDLCQNRIRLYSVAMAIFDPVSLFRSPAADQLPELVLSALNAFEAGDYAAAQAIYESLPYEVSFHPLLDFSAGLIAEASGDDAAALAIYDRSAAQVESYPFVYYVRGNLFARLGRAEAAAFDFATFNQYVASDPKLNAAAEQLAADYPISELAFEEWLLYSVLHTGGGPGGGWAYDETMTPPSLFRLAPIEEGARLVIENIRWYFLFDDISPQYLLLSQNASGSYHSAIRYSDDYGNWGTDLNLDLNSQPAVGAESSVFFEASGSRHFVLAPDGQPDPREQFDLFRCEGGAMTRMKVGAHGYSLRFQGVPMMDQPAGQATGDIAGDVTANSTGFTVLQGPECIGDQAWWQVESDSGAVGWIAENEGFEYRVLAPDAPPIPPMR